MKDYTLRFFFPEAAAAHAYQTVNAKGSSLNVAVNRGTAEVMKRKPIKGKRITMCEIKIWLNKPIEEESESES